MPKRKSEEKIKRYRRKIRKLEEEGRRKYARILYSSDESENSDNDVVEESNARNTPIEDKENEDPPLDPDILSALGEITTEAPKFGTNIHENLSQLWMPLLKKGLSKDTKEKLLKEYAVPENCQLLQAPKLNPEISAAIAESSRANDKKIEAVQQQLGQGITALYRGLGLLLDDGNDKLQAIKFLSDSCRILCDLHHSETEARKKCITPNLDKAFLNIAQDVDRDDLLYGNNLSEKIKATKVVEKQGKMLIKKPPPAPKTPATSYQPAMNRPRQQGNWTGPPPPRFSSNRGRREGQRGRGSPAGRRTQSTALAIQNPSTQSKQPRATGQQ